MIQIKNNNLNQLADLHCEKLKPMLDKNLKKYKEALKEGLKDIKDDIKSIYDKLDAFMEQIDDSKMELLLKGNKDVLMSFTEFKKNCEDFKAFEDKCKESKEKNGRIVIKIQDLRSKDKKVEKKLYPLEILLNIFDYDTFSSKTTEGHNGFTFAQELNLDTCPYCNRQSTHTVMNSEVKILRPDLDHFVPKSKYPYLALSFYNLVPCCQICNSRFKSDKEFTFEDNLHPFTEGWGNEIKFRLKVNDIAFFQSKKRKEKTAFAKIDINFDRATNEIKRKAARNNDVFQLEAIYQNHLDYVFELVNKAMIYNDDYIDSLYKQFEGSLFSNREDVLRFVTANYIDEAELHLRPLSKLTKDIIEQFDL